MNIFKYIFNKFKSKKKEVVVKNKLLQTIAQIYENGIDAEHKKDMSPLDQIKVAIMMIEATGIDSSNPLHVERLYDEVSKLKPSEAKEFVDEGKEEARDEFEKASPNAFVIANASKMTH